MGSEEESEFHKRFGTDKSKQYKGLSGSGDPNKLLSSKSAASVSSTVYRSTSAPELPSSVVSTPIPDSFKGSGTPDGRSPTVDEITDAEHYLRSILQMKELEPLIDMIDTVGRAHPNMKATAFKCLLQVPPEDPNTLDAAAWSSCVGKHHDPAWVLYHGTQISRLTAALSAGRLIRGQNAKSRQGQKLNGVYASRSLVQSLAYAPIGKEEYHTVLLLKTTMSSGFGGTVGSSTWCQRVCLEEFTSIEYLLLIPVSEYQTASGVTSRDKLCFYQYHATSLALVAWY